MSSSNTTVTTDPTMIAQTTLSNLSVGPLLKSSYDFGTSPQTPSSSSSSSTRKFYLFGSPIAHSLAPLLHNTLFKSLNLPNYSYHLHESLDIPSCLTLLHDEKCIGSAITMPHKISMLGYLDDITPEGRIIGAVNTVFVRLDDKRERKYIGTNTDYIGIRDAFIINYPEILEECKNKPGLVVGGGGACRSAVYACWKMGVSKVYIVNRDKEEVEGVISDFKKHGGQFDGEVVYVGSVEEAEVLERPVVVVGTVPDFTPKEEGEVRARAIVEVMMGKLKKEQQEEGKGGKGYVVEMCYHPRLKTEFYEICEKGSWGCIRGTEPMIYQGIAQQVLWTERPLEEFEKGIEEASGLIKEVLAKHRH